MAAVNNVKDFFEYIFGAFKICVIVHPWEAGIRVRCGKRIKKLSRGVYFRIPYFDNVFVQENRLRVSDMQVQTLTTKDFKTITLSCVVGYSITDVETLYNTLYHPETTLRNIAMSCLAVSIFSKDIAEIKPEQLADEVLAALKATNYGLSFEYCKITNFAVVRTFRLIQDTQWAYEALKMSEKK